MCIGNEFNLISSALCQPRFPSKLNVDWRLRFGGGGGFGAELFGRGITEQRQKGGKDGTRIGTKPARIPALPCRSPPA